MRVLRAAAAWIAGIVLLGASCRARMRPSFREIGKGDWDVVLRLPEGIYSMTSSPDSALFVIAFSGGGPVYRSRPGHDTEWSKVIVTQPGQPIFRTVYAPTATTVFGFGDGHLLRWDEGKGITDFGAPPGPSKFCGMFDMPSYAAFGPTSLWGRSDHDVFAVGNLGMVLHYDGTEWKPMRTSIRDEIKDICDAPNSTMLSSVGGNEHDVFAAGARYLRLSTDGEWTELEQPEGIGDGAIMYGIAAQGGTVFFGGAEFIRNANPPRLYLPARLLALTGKRLRMIAGYDNVTGMNGGGAQPGSAAVFWSFDKDLLIIDGSSVRVLRMSSFRSVRGAVAVGHAIYVAGLPRGQDDEVVVRLR